MTKIMSNYDKMVIIYGNDGATSEQSETSKELRWHQASTLRGIKGEHWCYQSPHFYKWSYIKELWSIW